MLTLSIFHKPTDRTATPLVLEWEQLYPRFSKPLIQASDIPAYSPVRFKSNLRRIHNALSLDFLVLKYPNKDFTSDWDRYEYFYFTGGKDYTVLVPLKTPITVKDYSILRKRYPLLGLEEVFSSAVPTTSGFHSVYHPGQWFDVETEFTLLQWLKSLHQEKVRNSYIYQYSPRRLGLRGKKATLAAMEELEAEGKVFRLQEANSLVWKLV